jgi:Niemann-Pick C1 protein
MFVIVQCLENLTKDQLSSVSTTQEKIGLAMKHAGVAITVTSVTDIFAFGVGACTVRVVKVVLNAICTQ